MTPRPLWSNRLAPNPSVLAEVAETNWSIPLWQFVSSPVRWARRRWDQVHADCPIAILFYHRIADRDITPWTMTNAEFASQIDALAARFEIISLREANRRLVARRSDRPAVVLTFDDGYRENLDEAMPRLIEAGLPVTYFVTTGHIWSGDPFPHDVALGHRFPVNTIEDVQWMHEQGVDIGVHTRSHADLGTITDPHQRTCEIAGAADDLTDWLGRRWRESRPYFAFPYGQKANLCHDATALARQIGLGGVVSAYGGLNRPSTADGFHLTRFHADRSLARVLSWVTDDPRWWSARPTMPPSRSQDSAVAPTGA